MRSRFLARNSRRRLDQFAPLSNSVGKTLLWLRDRTYGVEEQIGELARRDRRRLGDDRFPFRVGKLRGALNNRITKDLLGREEAIERADLGVWTARRSLSSSPPRSRVPWASLRGRFHAVWSDPLTAVTPLRQECDLLSGRRRRFDRPTPRRICGRGFAHYCPLDLIQPEPPNPPTSIAYLNSETQITMAHAQNCDAPRRACPVVRPRRPEGEPAASIVSRACPAASHGARQDGATDMAPRPLDRTSICRMRSKATRRTRPPAPPASAARPTNDALQGSCARASRAQSLRS